MPDTEPVLLVEDADAVRILTLHRPHKLNALDTALTTAVLDALIAADVDDTVRAVVLTGAGRAFCAGADLGEFQDFTPAHRDRVARRAELTARTQIQPTRLGKPVVAAVRGVAVGGGAGLALACDMVVAGSDLRFGYPEVKHAIVPALVMTSLTRHLGRKLAFELISTGRLLAADECLAHGVANEVMPPEQVLDRAVEIAHAWSAHSPEALRAIKDLFYRVADLPTDAAMRVGRDVNEMMRGYRTP